MKLHKKLLLAMLCSLLCTSIVYARWPAVNSTVPGTSGQCLINSSGNVGATDCGSGGGSPGGSDTQVQFNNSSAFGGSALFTWTGAYVHVGDSATVSSTDPQVLVSRNVTDSVAGNGHAFSDSSTISRTGTIAYNSFDARALLSGTTSYDHYAAFQAAPTFNFVGTITNYYAFYASLTKTSGTVTNAYGLYVVNPTGAVVNAFGVRVEALTQGSATNTGVSVSGPTGTATTNVSILAGLPSGATTNWSVSASTSLFALASAGAETLPLVVNNLSNTDLTGVGISFVAATPVTTVTAKIVNKRNAGSDYSLNFYTFGGSGLVKQLEIDKSGNIISTGLKTTGAATGKTIVCVDVTTGQLYASTSGVACAN